MKSEDFIENLAKEANVEPAAATNVLKAIGLDADLIRRMGERKVDLGKLRTAVKAIGTLSV